jgi:phage portal protein BeeE
MKFLQSIKLAMNLDKSKNKKSLAVNLKSNASQSNSYFYNIGKPVWMERNYQQFAQEAYTKNVVAYRAINMIAGAAASIGLKMFDYKGNLIENHPIIGLLYKPNPHQNKSEFLESLYLYRLISGNAYVLSASNTNKLPKEIYSLRPYRVNVIAGDNFLPIGYQYKVDKREQVFSVDQIHGLSRVLHIKNSHPISDWYGLSAIEAAAYSIDQHNNAAAWNHALLQNVARPSGAIVVKGADGRLKEISLSTKDMDFIEGKHSAARDIALVFGVPPQLLGIPGDNTYSNLVEAKAALWEQTILPLVENTIDHIGRWLAKLCKDEFVLKLDKDNISAMASKREAIWERLEY